MTDLDDDYDDNDDSGDDCDDDVDDDGTEQAKGGHKRDAAVALLRVALVAIVS